MIRPSAPTDRYLRVPELAARLQVSQDKILGLIAAGQLQAIDVRSPGSSRPRWRIAPDALRQFELARSATAPPAPTPRRRRAADSEVVHFFR